MIVLSPIFTGSSQVPIYCHREAYFDVESTCPINCTVETPDVVYSSVVQEVSSKKLTTYVSKNVYTHYITCYVFIVGSDMFIGLDS